MKPPVLVFEIKFYKRSYGFFIPDTGEYQDNENNDSNYDSLQECLEGIFQIYDYEKKYDYSYWVEKLVVKPSFC